MSNYKNVFDALCMANELDKYDINTLNLILDSELGSDILDGTEILCMIAQAESDYDEYARKRDSWYSEFMDAKLYELIYLDMCYYTYIYYDRLADKAIDEKNYWENRGNLLISLAESLGGLFVNGNDFRDCAKRGIDQISTSFDSSNNSYKKGDISWNNSILSLLEDRVYSNDKNIDWKLVEQILSKDADSISDTEYMIVTYAYMYADLDELNDFFIMCSVPEDVRKTYWFNLIVDNKLDNLSMGNMDVLILDSKKIDLICRQANNYQANLLAMIRYGNLSDSDTDMLIAERDDIVQRITLAHTLDEIHTFYDYREEQNYLDFKYTDEGFGPDESVKVNYNSLMPASQTSIALLDSHSFTVTNTMTDIGLHTYSTRKLKNTSLKKLTSYSTAIVGENVAELVTDAIVDGIPGSGFISFGLGYMEDIYQNNRKYEFIIDSYNIQETADVATYFDCCGNVILYDDNNVCVAIYEGIHTDERVEKISDLLDNSNLDTEYMIENTGEIFQECYDYLSEYGDKEFEKIVEGD